MTEKKWKSYRELIMHHVIEGFRRKSLMEFLKLKTIELCKNIQTCEYMEDRIKTVRKVQGDGVTKAILVGAVMSPACFHEERMQTKVKRGVKKGMGERVKKGVMQWVKKRGEVRGGEHG